ncbi:MAG TPA: DUF58 domain-containing protein [Humisphaera sp.]|jgi:uncharacterized protein (DUF58 family)|nr:DUF58 domain-containing protein [Humisphaera sp.]
MIHIVGELPLWLNSRLACLMLAAAAAGLCGGLVHRQGYVAMIILLAIVSLGLVWPWISVRGLSASMSFEKPRGREGDRTRVVLTVLNRWPPPAWALSLEAGGIGGKAPGAINLGGWQSRSWSWEFTPACRGVFPETEATIGCEFPFGLWMARRPVKIAQRLVVWPKAFSVAWTPSGDSGGIVGVGMRGAAGTAGDFLGVRAYRRGDPLRLINWRQTARHGSLIVRELQETSQPHVRIILNTSAADYGNGGPDGAREWAIRTAASLLESWSERGVCISLKIGSRLYPPAASRCDLERLLDGLAKISSSGEPLDLSDVAIPRDTRGLVIVITSDLWLQRFTRSSAGSSPIRFIALGAGTSTSTIPAQPPAEAWVFAPNAADVTNLLRWSHA